MIIINLKRTRPPEPIFQIDLSKFTGHRNRESDPCLKYHGWEMRYLLLFTQSAHEMLTRVQAPLFDEPRVRSSTMIKKLRHKKFQITSFA